MNIYHQSGSTAATATFATRNKIFSVSQTHSGSHPFSISEDIKKITEKSRKYFWVSYIADGNILSGIFGEMLCPMCECSSLALYERYERKEQFQK